MTTNWRTGIYRELNRKLIDQLGAKTSEQLAKLGVYTVSDLVRMVPYRHIFGTGMTDFSSLRPGQDVAVVGQILCEAQTHFSRQFRITTVLTDGTGQIGLTFFTNKKHYAEYWKSLLKVGERGIFIGKITEYGHQLQMAHPNFAMLDQHNQISAKRDLIKQAAMRAVQRETMVGLYPATASLPTWVIADSIGLLLPQLYGLGDTLPEWVRQKAKVTDLYSALIDIHEPSYKAQFKRGLDRLRFDEAITTQVALAFRRADRAKQSTVSRVPKKNGILAAFDTKIPFKLTSGQVKVSEDIFADLAKNTPMNRLLQGEVGSGKTIVALRAMLAVVDSGAQAALLAPTEVLAKQHYATITKLLGDLGKQNQLGAATESTRIALLTATRSSVSKRKTLDEIASGEAGIVIGTHALLSESVKFKDLGLIVVDEQHRFGVEQRSALSVHAEYPPHCLTMTATPIPRSVAMTIFGDLAVSTLSELPAGRSKVQTVVINTLKNPNWVERAWQRILEEVAEGRQAFIVCPAIEPGKTENDLEYLAEDNSKELVNVTGLYRKLSEGPLASLRLGMVHGRQPVKERDLTMAKFVSGEIDVLIATTVIEVGVDVPNASVMVIMDADRFGISQLHQLRGRIGRGTYSGLCLLVAEIYQDGDPSAQRLRALAGTSDGFELAEADLRIRREGNVLGAAQSGKHSGLRILKVIDDIEVIELAREIAQEIVDKDPQANEDWLHDIMVQVNKQNTAEWLEKN